MNSLKLQGKTISVVDMALGLFCYADDLCLLCPSFTGIKEMLKTCEDYAMKHTILFNAKNSQMLTFDHKSRISVKPILKIKNFIYENQLFIS